MGATIDGKVIKSIRCSMGTAREGVDGLQRVMGENTAYRELKNKQALRFELKKIESLAFLEVGHLNVDQSYNQGIHKYY